MTPSAETLSCCDVPRSWLSIISGVARRVAVGEAVKLAAAESTPETGEYSSPYRRNEALLAWHVVAQEAYHQISAPPAIAAANVTILDFQKN